MNKFTLIVSLGLLAITQIFAQGTLNPPVIQTTPEIQNPKPLPPAPPSPDQRNSNEMVQPTPIVAPVAPKGVHDMFSFEIAPEYVTNNSKSDFWHRDYSTESPAFSLGLNFWFHPNWGVVLNYRTSEMASVIDNTSKTVRQETKHEWQTWGFTYKVYWDEDPFSSYFMFSLLYDKYSFNVDSDSGSSANSGRNDLETKGVIFNFEGGIPAGERGAIILSADLAPNLSHSESSNTYTGTSGSSPDAFGIGLGLAYKYKVARLSYIKVGLDYYEEINQFSGQTSVNDPLKGTQLENVRVKNIFQTLHIGFSLGF